MNQRHNAVLFFLLAGYTDVFESFLCPGITVYPSYPILTLLLTTAVVTKETAVRQI